MDKTRRTTQKINDGNYKMVNTMQIKYYVWDYVFLSNIIDNNENYNFFWFLNSQDAFQGVQNAMDYYRVCMDLDIYKLGNILCQPILYSE